VQSLGGEVRRIAARDRLERGRRRLRQGDGRGVLRQAAASCLGTRDARTAMSSICTALIPGQKAPALVTDEMVATDAARQRDRRHGGGAGRQLRSAPRCRRRDGRQRRDDPRPHEPPRRGAGAHQPALRQERRHVSLPPREGRPARRSRSTTRSPETRSSPVAASSCIPKVRERAGLPPLARAAAENRPHPDSAVCVTSLLLADADLPPKIRPPGSSACSPCFCLRCGWASR